MNETIVRDILDQIDQLHEDDRLLLERRLTERAEAQWLWIFAVYSIYFWVSGGVMLLRTGRFYSAGG